MSEYAQSKPLIRPAGEHDLAAILALYAQPDMDDGAVLGLPEARRVFAQMAQVPDYTLYVAELDGQTVGTFALLIMPNLGHCGTPAGVLEDIAVAPELHSRGIGTAMIEEAVRLCRAKGCYKMTLSSNIQRSRAHDFYDRLGFARHGYSFRIDLTVNGSD